MANITIQKRGKVYQYKFEIAPVDGKRKFINKSGFKTKAEAHDEAITSYNEYLNTGDSFTPSTISYSDYLDYYIEQHCKINLRYATVQTYLNIINKHIKPKLGHYRLSQLTTSSIQDFINNLYVVNGFAKSYLKSIMRVVGGSLSYATDIVKFIKKNPAKTVRIPRYEVLDPDPVHIFTNEEINLILNRFKESQANYYAFLTAYSTGLRVSEVYGLTWDDIDLEKGTISVNKKVIKKNQAGGSKNRHISGSATGTWYFGTPKTIKSNRTVTIGPTLINALKQYKELQEQQKIYYGDSYIKQYTKIVINPFNNKEEIKILSVPSEIEVLLPEANLVFVKKNGAFEGTDTPKYPFKIIHYELGIQCRFHDFRDTHATRLIEAGEDIKVVSERLGHANINITYEIYVRVTENMIDKSVERFEELSKDLNVVNIPRDCFQVNEVLECGMMVPISDKPSILST